MLHFHYSKIDKSDMRAVLSKKYDPEDKSEAAVVCKKRQEAIRKSVVSTNYMWGTAAASAGMVTWSFRRYNYQSRLIAVPFIFYGMTFFGRCFSRHGHLEFPQIQLPVSPHCCSFHILRYDIFWPLLQQAWSPGVSADTTTSLASLLFLSYS